jgi:hypothetical protein
MAGSRVGPDAGDPDDLYFMASRARQVEVLGTHRRRDAKGHPVAGNMANRVSRRLQFWLSTDRTITTGIDAEGVFERADRICRSSRDNKFLFMVALDLIKELDPQHSEVCLH